METITEIYNLSKFRELTMGCPLSTDTATKQHINIGFREILIKGWKDYKNQGTRTSTVMPHL